MHPAGAALRVGGVLRVTPDAAPGGQQGLGVGGDGSHRHTLDVEIRRSAQKVLAGLAAAAVRYPLVICTGFPKCSRMHCSSTTSSSSRRTTSLPLQANSRTLKLGESCRVESRDMEYSLIAIETTTFLFVDFLIE